MRRSVLGALVASVMLLLPTTAIGHSWYDPWCCNEGDCTEMSKAEQRGGQWWYENQYGNSAPVIPGYTRILQSKDGKTHACVWQDKIESGMSLVPQWKLRCLYIPGGN